MSTGVTGALLLAAIADMLETHGPDIMTPLLRRVLPLLANDNIPRERKDMILRKIYQDRFNEDPE